MCVLVISLERRLDIYFLLWTGLLSLANMEGASFSLSPLLTCVGQSFGIYSEGCEMIAPLSCSDYPVD